MRFCVPIPCFFNDMDFCEAIRKVRSLGFDAVETYDWTKLDLDRVRSGILSDHEQRRKPSGIPPHLSAGISAHYHYPARRQFSGHLHSPSKGLICFMLPRLRNMTSLYLTSDEGVLCLFRIGSKIADKMYIGTAGGHFEKDELNDPLACAKAARFQAAKASSSGNGVNLITNIG